MYRWHADHTERGTQKCWWQTLLEWINSEQRINSVRVHNIYLRPERGKIQLCPFISLGQRRRTFSLSRQNSASTKEGPRHSFTPHWKVVELVSKARRLNLGITFLYGRNCCHQRAVIIENILASFSKNPPRIRPYLFPTT